jgi:hypothetical protein
LGMVRQQQEALVAAKRSSAADASAEPLLLPIGLLHNVQLIDERRYEHVAHQLDGLNQP